MEDTKEPIQNIFLQGFVTKQTHVQLYLTNGVKLTGFIADFDKNVIVLSEKSRSSQLVFISNISTISEMNKNV